MAEITQIRVLYRPGSAVRLDGVVDDTRAAMVASPGYFAGYYVFKSFALVGALVVAAFCVGRLVSR